MNDSASPNSYRSSTIAVLSLTSLSLSPVVAFRQLIAAMNAFASATQIMLSANVISLFLSIALDKASLLGRASSKNVANLSLY